MKRFLLALGLAVFLTGCGSSVNLDDVPVEDKSGAAVGAIGGQAAAGPGAGSGTTGTTGNAGSVGNTAIAPVDLVKPGTSATAPAGPRIVYFDYDSFVIKPEFQSVIEAHANFVKADRNRRVAIEGHTDERGGREYNLSLGQKRSEAVRRALGLLGVPDTQIEAVSFGKEKPAVQGSDESALARNRRAEIAYR